MSHIALLIVSRKPSADEPMPIPAFQPATPAAPGSSAASVISAPRKPVTWSTH